MIDDGYTVPVRTSIRRLLCFAYGVKPDPTGAR